MRNDPDSKPHEFFLATWQVYRKIVDGNYMYHREIFGEILRIMHEVAHRQLTILDLGCGDAGTIRPVLEQISFAHYLGADASQPALDIAKEELQSLGEKIELQCSDMLAVLSAKASSKFDVILASFSLHHLDPIRKGDFLALCKNRMVSGGRLIIVDVFRNAHQTREDYLDDYCEIMNQQWTSLSPAESQMAIEHVRAHDYPESIEDFVLMAKASGLRIQGEPIHHGYHALVTFST